MEAQGVPEEDQRRMLPLFLTQAAKEWYYTETNLGSIDEAMQKLEEHFSPPDRIIRAMQSFYSRVQSTAESAKVYANSLKELARRTGTMRADGEMMARFISGLAPEVQFT